MKVRLTPRALADAKRMRTWWSRHRSKAPILFDEELDAVLKHIGATPKTRNHVYYAVEGAEAVVLSVWGALKGRGPKL
jgi:hypothetical protein